MFKDQTQPDALSSPPNEALWGKKTGELVKVARDLGIKGLFDMTSFEIVEEICKRRKVLQEFSELSPSSVAILYQDDIEEGLLKMSRPELVDIGRVLGIEGMFSMRPREIAEKICDTEKVGEVLEDIEDKAECQPTKQPQPRPFTSGRKDGDASDDGERTGNQSPEAVDESNYAEKIRRLDSKSAAMEQVNKFASAIRELEVRKYDEKMKSLFDELSVRSKSEIGAREHIISLCSTKRTMANMDIADWVYDMYKQLGYPIDRSDHLNMEDVTMNLQQGERYIAREEPYRGR